MDTEYNPLLYLLQVNSSRTKKAAIAPILVLPQFNDVVLSITEASSIKDASVIENDSISKDISVPKMADVPQDASIHTSNALQPVDSVAIVDHRDSITDVAEVNKYLY